MTAEGRLARGKANFDSHKFLKNAETLAYAKTLEKPKLEPKQPEAKKSGKSKSR